MANEQDNRPQRDADRESDYIRGGKGRKDEVGGSGIYPASAPNVPEDAELRTEGELVGHEGGRRKPEEQPPKIDQSSGSE